MSIIKKHAYEQMRYFVSSPSIYFVTCFSIPYFQLSVILLTRNLFHYWQMFDYKITLISWLALSWLSACLCYIINVDSLPITAQAHYHGHVKKKWLGHSKPPQHVLWKRRFLKTINFTKTNA